jgi:hypothetical protein
MWVEKELKPDHILALRLRAGRERDLVRANGSLLFVECLAKIAKINRKYSAMIEKKLIREVFRHASTR